jgi:hypothetical protein
VTQSDAKGYRSIVLSHSGDMTRVEPKVPTTAAFGKLRKLPIYSREHLPNQPSL